MNLVRLRVHRKREILARGGQAAGGPQVAVYGSAHRRPPLSARIDGTKDGSLRPCSRAGQERERRGFLVRVSGFGPEWACTVQRLCAPSPVFSRKEDRRRKVAGIILLLIFIGGIGSILFASGLGSTGFMKFNLPPIDIATIGRQMVTYYAPVLILLGLTLAASVIGALALARREDIEQKNERVN